MTESHRKTLAASAGRHAELPRAIRAALARIDALERALGEAVEYQDEMCATGQDRRRLWRMRRVLRGRP